MKIKNTVTNRGFSISEFEDKNFSKCSLQESSSATERCVWFGCDDIELRKFKSILEPNGRGWESVSEDTLKELLDADCILANTRMHLSQKQVKKLLPALKHFAKHGCLPTK